MGRLPARATVRRLALPVAAGLVLFAVTCSWRGGLHDDSPSGDLLLYEALAGRMLDGELPYRDSFVEYPPGALPVFLVPRLVSEEHYRLLFQLLMAAFGAAALVLVAIVLHRVGASRTRIALAVGFVASAPALLGPVFLQRYDLWPTLLALAGMVVLVAGRAAPGFGLLGLGTAAKVFPAALVPVALLRLRRSAVPRALAAFVGAGVAVAGVFALLAPTGLGFTLSVQARRGLQIESLGASLLLALDRLGLYEATVVSGAPGSKDLAGTAADLVAAASTPLQLLAVAAVVALAARTRLDGELVLLASAAALVAVVAFGKVLSPQFLVWLVPFVPLVAGRAGLAASALLAAALVLTQLWFVDAVTPFDLDAEAWLALTRNLLLVGAYAVLVARLRGEGRPREATEGQIAAAPAAQRTKKVGRLA